MPALAARPSPPLCSRPSRASRSSRLAHFALLSLPFASPRSLSSRPLRTSLLAALGLSPLASRLSPLASRLSPLASRLSPLVACSPEHFSLAHFPRLAAYLRRRCSRVRFVRSFALFCTRLLSCSRLALASLSSALLRSRSSAHRLPLLSSCLAFCLFSPRASPLSSRLDTPHQKQLAPALPHLYLQQGRISTTWAGEPSKMVLLKEVVTTIIEERLLDNVKRVGAKLLTGLYELQVRSSCGSSSFTSNLLIFLHIS